MTLRALSVASEMFPLIKTGGLADVAGALPAALAGEDVAVTTLLPGYPAVTAALGEAETVHTYTDLFGTPARLLAAKVVGLDLLVLDAPALFARAGNPYSDAKGKDWPDNGQRFAALGRAGADAATLFGFDLLHAHDWQAGLAPAYLRFGKSAVPSVMTIHNIAFQGWFPPLIFSELGLPAEAFATEGIEYFGGVGYLKAGLWAADAITTVSPTYAMEIRTPEFGSGMEGLIAARASRVFGIVNGIDTAIWDPSRDEALAAPFDLRALARRARNKAALAERFSLEDSDGPLFCAITRLTVQKGMDVLANVTDTLVALGGRLIVLGKGEAAIEDAFLAAAARHPAKIAVTLGYDEALAHRMQGGADAILIPSRFEPCGLTQLCGLRYGCVPIAARTGGLADTIIDANEAALTAGVATGFLFDGVNETALTSALARAVSVFRQRETWRALQRCAMKTDVSWTASAKRYAALYRGLAGA